MPISSDIVEVRLRFPIRKVLAEPVPTALVAGRRTARGAISEPPDVGDGDAVGVGLVVAVAVAVGNAVGVAVALADGVGDASELVNAAAKISKSTLPHPEARS